MTPGARLAAAIEILTEAETTRLPLDRALERWAKANRYAGSKDRAAISSHVYDVMRARALLADRMASEEPRALLLASLKLTGGRSTDEIAALAGDGKYALGVLTEEERARLEAATPGKPGDARPVRLNYPAWLDPYFERAFGQDIERELGALNLPAPVDLRVNTLKATRESVAARLSEEGVDAQPTYWSPWGLRLASPRKLKNLGPLREGEAEIQDEGSQLVSALLGAQPGEKVIDYCAGAGGKTLAIGAMMAGQGEILACDVDGRRLRRLRERAKRAGLHNIAVEELTGGGLTGMEGRADRLILDVPCSGTGTWRRQPEARWRLTPEDLGRYIEAQALILDQAAPLLRSGGLMLYITCSCLREENEDQIAGFLKRHADFELSPWSRHLPEGWPPPLRGEGPFLRLSPATSGTDGFFAALLGRAA